MAIGIDSKATASNPTPKGSVLSTISWDSTDKSVATINPAGEITTLKAGSSTITGTDTDTSVTSKSELTVSAPVVSSFKITFNPTTVPAGTSSKATASDPVPENSVLGEITWKSESEDIATIDASGTITTLKAGNVAIVGTDVNSTTISQEMFSVTAPAPQSFTLVYPKTSLVVGDNSGLPTFEDILPVGSELSGSFTYTSTTIAVSISQTGVVEAVSAGSAEVLCVHDGSGISSTCTFTVTDV